MKKDALQQHYLFTNCLKIFKNDASLQAEVVPFVLEKIHTFPEDVQAQTGTMFYNLIEQEVSLQPKLFEQVPNNNKYLQIF